MMAGTDRRKINRDRIPPIDGSLTDHWQKFHFDSLQNLIVQMHDKISKDRSIIRQIEVSQRLFVLFRGVSRLVFLSTQTSSVSLSL